MQGIEHAYNPVEWTENFNNYVLNFGEHNERVSVYTKILLDRGTQAGVFGYTSEADLQTIAMAAKFHDLGKIRIPDKILMKKGGLSPDEMNMIRMHPQFGAQIMDKAIEMKPKSKIFAYAFDIALFHHERWDGGGYPCGSKGREIPLVARVVSIADMYDALRSKRPYKAPVTHKSAVRIMKQETGLAFDPALVELFLSVQEAFSKAHDDYYEGRLRSGMKEEQYQTTAIRGFITANT